jgi:hypothetical protein
MHGGRMQALAQQPHRRADQHDLARQQAQRFRPRLGGGKQAGQGDHRQQADQHRGKSQQDIFKRTGEAGGKLQQSVPGQADAEMKVGIFIANQLTA